MGWSDEVHSRRMLELRRRARKAQSQAPGSLHAAPMTGNAGILSIVAAASVIGGIVAWDREGRHLRSADIRRIPYVGDWLADHVPRWRGDSPRKRAASAAERRARAAQRALHKGEAQAVVGDASSVALVQEMSSSKARTDEATHPEHEEQKDPAKQPRARKRSKRK